MNTMRKNRGAMRDNVAVFLKVAFSENIISNNVTNINILFHPRNAAVCYYSG